MGTNVETEIQRMYDYCRIKVIKVRQGDDHLSLFSPWKWNDLNLITLSMFKQFLLVYTESQILSSDKQVQHPLISVEAALLYDI